MQWTVYVSTDSLTTISAGDTPVSAGTTGLLGASPASRIIGFTGTWPSAHGPYYLKVKLSAPDDINTANDIQASTVYTTTFVDYTVNSVTSTGPYLAGNAINASFTLQNVGSANGGQPVSWNAYVSTNATLDAGDTLVASGTTGQLNSLASSVVPISPVTGTWPNTIGGTYYLIVSVAAADDTGPASNVGASPGYVMSAPTVQYVVSSPVPPPVGSTLPAGIISSSFQLSNAGPNNGSQPVSWSAYASLTSSVDASAILIASGVWQPLASGAPSIGIPFSGPWPLHYGNYHLVVSASAPGDNNSGNIAGATAGITPVGFINEAEPNNDATNLSVGGVQNLGITLQPGMSVLVTRSLAGAPADKDDVFTLNTGTAASVSLYLSWSVSQNVTLNFLTPGPPAVPVATTTVPAGTNLSLSWNVTSLQTWIDVVNPGGETAYTLIITGN